MNERRLRRMNSNGYIPIHDGNEVMSCDNQLKCVDNVVPQCIHINHYATRCYPIFVWPYAQSVAPQQTHPKATIVLQYYIHNRFSVFNLGSYFFSRTKCFLQHF